VLKSPLAEPFAFSQGWVSQRSATLVELFTDHGLIGWGEAFAQGLEPPEIAAAAIEHALKPLVLGENPLDTEVLWHRMYHRTATTAARARSSPPSAVDTALWDIASQAHGLPVYQLLGGAFRRQRAALCHRLLPHPGQGEAARLADEALRHWTPASG
jgi:D-galactarolactone cycloisomerase